MKQGLNRMNRPAYHLEKIFTAGRRTIPLKSASLDDPLLKEDPCNVSDILFKNAPALKNRFYLFNAFRIKSLAYLDRSFFESMRQLYILGLSSENYKCVQNDSPIVHNVIYGSLIPILRSSSNSVTTKIPIGKPKLSAEIKQKLSSVFSHCLIDDYDISDAFIKFRVFHFPFYNLNFRLSSYLSCILNFVIKNELPSDTSVPLITNDKVLKKLVTYPADWIKNIHYSLL